MRYSENPNSLSLVAKGLEKKRQTLNVSDFDQFELPDECGTVS